MLDRMILPSHDVFLNVFLLIIGLLFIFFGTGILRILSSILFAILLGYLFFIESIKIFNSQILALLIAFIGMIIGGLIGFLILRLSIALIGGIIISEYLSKILDLNVLQTFIIFILISIVLYIVSREILVLATVFLGGFMIFYSLIGLGFNMFISAVISLILFILGLVFQLKR
ncbi:MAG: hypothetical protein LM586_04525 [Desulfurococcales archaeon]|jgi:hypothetical protein|nr:hypothetical protein [Desulfurococcales archaeon]MCI4456582.1 hypothetical protein [Desulfurococcaceae archaeon]